METPCLCPSEGHKHGGRKVTKTSVVSRFAIEMKISIAWHIEKNDTLK